MSLNKKSEILPKDLTEKFSLIEKLIDKGGKNSIVDLMELFKCEGDIVILNKIAKGFAKLNADLAVPLLMSYIRDPSYEDKRGTFIYSLIDLDCKDYFLDFVDMICFGNYEVYDHSFLVFESIVDEVGYNQRLKAIEILENQKSIEALNAKSAYPQFDRINYINDALEILRLSL